MKKKILFISLAIISIISVEVFMRLYFGFCDTVLMKEDSKFEYIAQPNQDRFRFRNHIKYNSLSMRSEEIDTASVKILGFGDSVINGGILTDHDSLATTLISSELSKLYGKKVQFLNISAGSWGPDNCFAYLNKYGDFGAKSIFLFVSSHDAYDNMYFEKIIDIHESFPSQQYKSALYELYDRYLVPRIKNLFKIDASETEKLGISKKDEKSIFNTGFKSFLDYSIEKNIPLTIYLHAEKGELKSKTYNDQGQEIIKFARDNQIPIILDLENGLDLSDFRDGIHINEKGQRKLAKSVIDFIKNDYKYR